MSPKVPEKTNYKNEIITCKNCHIEIPKNEYQYHLKTNLHKSNAILKTDDEYVDIIATAFKKRIITYKLNPSREYLTPEDFLVDYQNKILKLIKDCLNKHNCIKINFELFAYFILSRTGEQQLKSFNTKYEIVYCNSELNDLYFKLISTFERKLSEFQHSESGWSLFSISHLEVNINKYSPLKGGSYIDLPYNIKKTRSCLNIQNNDNYCFLWSITAALYPAKCNVCRTDSYPHFETVFKLDGLSFPPSFNDIKLFEKINSHISVNVYGLDDKNIVTGPLYVTSLRKENHVNLLYFEQKGCSHYCLIKNLLRLIRRQVSKHKGKMYLCETCLQVFTSETKFNAHTTCPNVLTILPEKNSILQFKNFERKQKINFVIYADFESILVNTNTNKTENTRTYQIHEPSCFGYYICCSHNPDLNKYVTYRGSDCVEVFIKKIINDLDYINSILSNKMPMTSLTKEQEKDYKNALKCHICNHFLFDDKVMDHDHVTSQYRGAAHSHCNLMYRVCPFVPVIFHNLTNYDSHLFIKELAKYKGPFQIIPKNKEKYMSFTKILHTKNSIKPIQVKFIDSFQFLNSSLSVLVKNLSEVDFINLSKEFPDINNDQLKLLMQKGIYPYDYVNAHSKYDKRQLPPKHYFYNSLKCEHIRDDEFEHAHNVWRTFNITTVGEYTDLYLKTDVLLLSDVFEKFRLTCLYHYQLDPAYYITAPSLSWDAMLLYTDVKLELINDLEIYSLLEKGIRGGLAQCSLRHAKANNKYLPDYDVSQKSTYLIYLDCNNLYGYAMTMKMPISEFRLLTIDEINSIDIITIPDDSEYGYILEVDLSYPEHLHNMHSDLPFAAEKFIPPGGKTDKLIANLYDKFNYIIHYVHLKECLNNGLILRKIHRIVTFRQDQFLKKYIDLNTSLRQASTSLFEKDFFKLLNNAIFGKTIENRRKQVNVKLVTMWDDVNNKTNKHLGAGKLIAKPNLKSVAIFSEDFVAVQLSIEKVILDRPIYIGFTVLEYAKTHLYKFHYNFIKNKYKNRARLCYTDTDSLLYFINTEDVYEDIKTNVIKYDTSNFESKNVYGIPKVNAKIPGLFKDELGGDVISEFVGLRAKLYCINSLKTRITKAKGISKAVTNRLKLSHYYKALLSETKFKCKMNVIKSIKHVLYSQEIHKVALNRSDDKRQVLPNLTETLPWGHCNTIF